MPSATAAAAAAASVNGGGSGGHECATCKKTFSRSDILRKHMKTHVPCPCPVCGQLFQDKFTLAKHQIEASLTTRVSNCNLRRFRGHPDKMSA